MIFDIDNTLVPHGAPADERAIALFEHLKKLGFKTCLLSNNKEARVKPFASQVKSPYIHKGGKPQREGIKMPWPVWGQGRRKLSLWETSCLRTYMEQTGQDLKAFL